MRCEDFPCCGHALNECPTGPAKECPDCGRIFEPCSLGTKYCLACGSRPDDDDDYYNSRAHMLDVLSEDLDDER